MDDLFFFTRRLLSVKELSAVANEFQYPTRVVAGAGGDELNIYYRDDGFWQWIPISASSGDFDAFDALSRAVVDEYQAKSAYIVAYRPLSWPALQLFLQRVLDQYGGWVGSDTDGWEPILTAENIANISPESYQEALEWQSKSDPHSSRNDE